MPSTVADVEGPLIRGVEGWLAEAGLSVTPSAEGSPNRPVLDAISAAMEALGATPAIFGAPTDAEVAAVPRGATFRGLANLYLLESILQNWAPASETVQGRSISYGDTFRAIQARIDLLRKQYSRYFLAPAVGGRIRINSAEPRCRSEL